MEAIRSRTTTTCILMATLVSIAIAITMAFAAPDRALAAGTNGAQSHDFTFTQSAYLTNGKGSAYKSYMSMFEAYGMADRATIVYKARIKGKKLYVTGAMSKGGKIVKLKNKAYKLTSKTKYYRHTGNGSFYFKSSKAKMKKLLAKKGKDRGGDIAFKLKNGKIVLLTAQ